VFAGQDEVVGLVPVASDGRRARNSFIESLKYIWFGFNFNLHVLYLEKKPSHSNVVFKICYALSERVLKG
jgi:hypothetical protein